MFKQIKEVCKEITEATKSGVTKVVNGAGNILTTGGNLLTGQTSPLQLVVEQEIKLASKSFVHSLTTLISNGVDTTELIKEARDASEKIVAEREKAEAEKIIKERYADEMASELDQLNQKVG